MQLNKANYKKFTFPLLVTTPTGKTGQRSLKEILFKISKSFSLQRIALFS